MTVFEVARLRRIALLAERWAAGMSRERLTAAIVTTWETA